MSDDTKQERGSESVSTRLTSRRKFLRIASTTGVSITSFSKLGAANSENQVEIVTIAHDGEAKKTETVPQAWKKQVDRADRVNRQVQQNRLNQKGIVSISTVRWEDESFDGRTGKQIKVQINSDEFEGNIPDEKDGVPIKVVEYDANRAPAASCVNISNFSSTHAGIEVNTSGNDSATRGSFGAPVKKGREFIHDDSSPSLGCM